MLSRSLKVAPRTPKKGLNTAIEPLGAPLREERAGSTRQALQADSPSMASSPVPRPSLDGLRLPPLPAIVGRIDSLVRDPLAGAREIGALVSREPALAARVLRAANSAFYGLRQRVLSTEHAAAVLGVRVLRNIVRSQHLDGVKGTHVAAESLEAAQVRRATRRPVGERIRFGGQERVEIIDGSDRAEDLLAAVRQLLRRPQSIRQRLSQSPSLRKTD